MGYGVSVPQKGLSFDQGTISHINEDGIVEVSVPQKGLSFDQVQLARPRARNRNVSVPQKGLSFDQDPNIKA